jgi:hypothetical protein
MSDVVMCQSTYIAKFNAIGMSDLVAPVFIPVKCMYEHKCHRHGQIIVWHVVVNLRLKPRVAKSIVPIMVKTLRYKIDRTYHG